MHKAIPQNCSLTKNFFHLFGRQSRSELTFNVIKELIYNVDMLHGDGVFTG